MSFSYTSFTSERLSFFIWITKDSNSGMSFFRYKSYPSSIVSASELRNACETSGLSRYILMEYIILDPYRSPAWLNSSVPESAWRFIFMDSTASFVAISSGMRGLLCSLALQPTLHAMNNIIVMQPKFFTKLFKPGSSSNFILVVYQAEVYFSIKPIIFFRLGCSMLPIPFISLIFDL